MGLFYGESCLLKTPYRDFNLAIVGELGWMKWLKNRAGKCIYFMQLFLESQAWKNKIEDKMGRLKRWWYLSILLTITITSFDIFDCPVKFKRNLKLKFRSKINHYFTNHGYLHSAVWKALHNVKIKRAQEAKHNQFFFQNVHKMRSLRSSKCLKTTVELTFTTQKANACSPWTACSVFNWKYLFG